MKDSETSAFAKYVFIDATNAKQSDKNKSSSDKIYLLDFDRIATDADDNEYYQYNAIVNGEETKVKLDADEFTKLDQSAFALKDVPEFTLYDSIRYDSKTGYITDMDKVLDTDDDYTVKDITKATVDYKNGVLTIKGTESYDFTVADSCKVYLVVEAGVASNDNDDDYAVSTLTASGLKAELKGYTFNGRFAAEETDDELTSLYVYVSANAQ